MIESSVWSLNEAGEMIMSVPETMAQMHASTSLQTIYFFAEFNPIPPEDRLVTSYWYMDEEGEPHIMVDEEWARAWAARRPEHIVFAVDVVESHVKE